MKSEILFCFCLLSFGSSELLVKQLVYEQGKSSEFPLSDILGATLKPFSGKHKSWPVIVDYTLTDTVISRKITGNVTYTKDETHLSVKLFNVAGSANGNIRAVAKINLLLFTPKIVLTGEFVIYMENSEAFVKLILPPKDSKEFEIESCRITQNNIRFQLTRIGFISNPKRLQRVSNSITEGLKDDLNNLFCKTVERELKKEEESEVFLYVYDKAFRQ